MRMKMIAIFFGSVVLGACLCLEAQPSEQAGLSLPSMLKLLDRGQVKRTVQPYLDTGAAALVGFGAISGVAGIYCISSGWHDIRHDKKLNGSIKITIGTVATVLNTALIAGSLYGYTRVGTLLQT